VHRDIYGHLAVRSPGISFKDRLSPKRVLYVFGALEVPVTCRLKDGFRYIVDGYDTMVAQQIIIHESTRLSLGLKYQNASMEEIVKKELMRGH
jgi:hypothetical protein